jgi:hypothetical protein
MLIIFVAATFNAASFDPEEHDFELSTHCPIEPVTSSISATSLLPILLWALA